jgi:hypothetical protein
MRTVRKVADVTAHLLLVAAALVAVVAVMSRPAYPPVRVADMVLILVLVTVWVLGRLPRALGPVAASLPAALVRLVAAALAAITAGEVLLGLMQGQPEPGRTVGAAAPATVVLAVCLAGYLAASRRGGELSSRAFSTSVGLGLLAAALFAGAVPVLPPELVWFTAFVLIVAAAVGSGRLIRPAETGVQAALLATVTACQAVFAAAVVLYHYGPDAWMPYAGPGPLTARAQIEQNRAEAIDPYVGLMFLGAVAAAFLTWRVVSGRLRRPGTAASA